MTCKVIATGSRGNALLLNGNILIDCGVSYSKIKEAERDIKLVLLTHIHSDHFNPRTIYKLFSNHPTIRFVCGSFLVEPLYKAGINPNNIDLLEPDTTYTYQNGVKIRAFNLYHDVKNYGYHVEVGSEKALYVTDTGRLEEPATEYDLYLIEANYKEKELDERERKKLEAGEYSHEARVRDTHLSREQAEEYLEKNAKVGVSQVVFLHQHMEDTNE